MKIFRISRIFVFLKWLFILLIVIFLIIPISVIYSSISDGSYHDGMLAAFIVYFIPVLVLFLLSDFYKYKIIVSEDYIEAPKLRSFFLNNYNDSNKVFWGIRRYDKKRERVLFSEVESATYEKQLFRSGRYVEYIFVIVFKLKSGEQKKIDITLSWKQKKDILEMVKRKISVDELVQR